MIYLLRLVISSRASLRAISKSVFSGWLLNYSAVHQNTTIFTQNGKNNTKNSKIFKIDYPYLYALILKAFFIFGHFGIFEKSI